MDLTSIIIIIGIIIVAIIIIKLLTKIAFKVVLIILLLAAAVYFLLFWNGGLLDLGNKDFILVELQAKYCEQDTTAKCIDELMQGDVKQELIELYESLENK